MLDHQPLIPRRVRNARWSLLAVAVSIASASETPCAMSEIMRPGMILEDLMFPLNPLDHRNLQVLSASRAEVREAPHLLWLSGLRFSVKERGISKFSLLADTAVYDFQQKTLDANDGFHANGYNLSFTGKSLSGTLENQVFTTDGYLEIQMPGLMPSAPARKSGNLLCLPPFHFDSSAQSILEPTDPMAPLELVGNFAGNLPTFVKCWKWMENSDRLPADARPASLVLISPAGGRFDLRRNDVQLTDPSLLIGPESVLVSNDGIRFRQETSDGDTWIRMSGKGGVKTWMHVPRSDVAWVRSATFDCVSDRKMLQFQGGPLVVCRQGIVLTAAESWQFVRVFSDNRIVLSPGAWNVVGDLITQVE